MVPYCHVTHAAGCPRPCLDVPAAPRGSRACCRTAHACSAWIPALPRSQPCPGPAAPQGSSEWDRRVLLWRCWQNVTFGGHWCPGSASCALQHDCWDTQPREPVPMAQHAWPCSRAQAAGLAPGEMTLGQEFCLISQQRGQRWEGKVSQVNMKS